MENIGICCITTTTTTTITVAAAPTIMNLRVTLQLKCLGQLSKSFLMKTIDMHSTFVDSASERQKSELEANTTVNLEHFSFHVV